ncbi:hypothetical protein DNHGIG_15530 [Collibacillus ludicampi]|uniref:DUF2088 domain-containing protein n=1 Tax=Collibacillus ludicampi TaxID=2771369 RepID=A0AAV4LDU7_9BACL|nr:DUF362 domain-containing protein [Collibacillus ludicampi]GIM46004.1 hypothetical protein DNHGIG_15530 [Collibacillus ludicampi]
MTEWPSLYKLKQHFSGQSVSDIQSETIKAVDVCLQNTRLSPGSRIAITAGSRGIKNIVQILQTIVKHLKDRGYSPFLVAAMGSHGRGEASGQREVLNSLGITETAIGTTVSCSDQVIQIGATEEAYIEGQITTASEDLAGLPVYIAKEAYEADGILVVNRVKPHTSFHGEYESGLLKMMAVGLGRAKGADMVHSLGAGLLAQAIPTIAGVILKHAPILGGIAIVENAFEETAIIQGIPANRIFQEEKGLLKKAKAMMPSLPVQQIDLCLVGEMGKNFSGTGMDTNIIGRLRIQGMPEPKQPLIKYLAVLGLSKESHGNATGIGLADFTTEAVVAQIDKKATYLNCLTSGFVCRAFIPMTFPTEQKLLEGAIKALKLKNPETIRLVYIKNTLHLDELWVSEPIYRELKNKENIERIEGPLPLQFDQTGRIKW